MMWKLVSSGPDPGSRTKTDGNTTHTYTQSDEQREPMARHQFHSRYPILASVSFPVPFCGSENGVEKKWTPIYTALCSGS